MSKDALVSIIVPVYKTEKYLDACVSSLVNQTYKNIEIILVDDGSPDNCYAICDKWEALDGRIKVIHKPNEGVSIARNAGIQKAIGKWLLFIDSDDTIPVRFVEVLVCANKGSEAIVLSRVDRFSNDVPNNENCTYIAKAAEKNLPAVRGGMYACGVLYNHELVNGLGLLFDKSLHNLEDVVWNSVYLRYISDVIYVDVPYFYRMNPTSITSQCVDIKWQITSWIAARKSIMNWFSDKDLTAVQKREVAGVFRHCQNNIYAECVAGSISYNELYAVEADELATFDKSLIPAPERFARKYFPKLYYGIYTSLIRVKNAIRK